MKSTLDRKVRLALGITILTLLLTGVLTYRWMDISDESGRWARHTDEVLEKIQDLTRAMEDIETASRGFALTGKESELDNYDSSVLRAKQDQAAIRRLTADNSTQQNRIPTVESQVYASIQLSDRVIDLRRTQGTSAALGALESLQGEQINHDFQAVAARLRDEELHLLALRRAETDRDRSQSRAFMIVGTLLGMLIAGIAGWSALRDSARRELVERALRESEEKYRMLLEAAPDGMVVVNQAGEIVLLNAQAEEQFGYRRDELLGQNVTSIIPKGFAERLFADGTRTAAEALAQQVGTGIELHGLRKDGTEFPIEITLSPLNRFEGIFVTAAIRNIALRKDAEKRLAQMEAKYRGLLEAAPDGMVVVNEDGEIVLLNAQAEKQFGYHRDELLGRNVKDIIPEGFAERLIADARRTKAEAPARQIGTEIELLGRRKDGTQFPVEVMLSPLESNEGVLVTAAIRDISERKELARQLRQSLKMEAIGQLTGGIAHDFNNLLAIVIGNLGLMERMIDGNEPAMMRLKPAQKAAARGAALSRRLLALASKEDLNPARIRIDDVIQETIEFAARALGPEIRIVTHFDDSVPPVFVDATGLGSALLNLTVNARDAMPKGGTLTISTQMSNLDESFPPVRTGELKSGTYARISVSDTGHGMSKEVLERALEPFFTTKARSKGTGLGLAMVYGFARQSGGTVRLYSEQGCGTTVSLYLPPAGECAPAVCEVPEAESSGQPGGTVLVVDDEGELLEIARIYLTEMGYSALCADNAATALNTLAQYKEIDLMITDIIMPGGMNGVELAEKARRLRPNLKVIYSSGFPADALAERADTKVDGPILRKPYHRTEFVRIVQHTLKGAAA